VSEPSKLAEVPRKVGSGLRAIEREVILRTSDGDKTWNLYTASPKWYRKFERLFGPGRVIRGGSGYEWDVPIHEVSIRKRRKRILTEEQKAAAAANFKKARGG